MQMIRGKVFAKFSGWEKQIIYKGTETRNSIYNSYLSIFPNVTYLVKDTIMFNYCPSGSSGNFDRPGGYEIYYVFFGLSN
jgi:hypothetical protein